MTVVCGLYWCQVDNPGKKGLRQNFRKKGRKSDTWASDKDCNILLNTGTPNYIKEVSPVLYRESPVLF